MCTAVGLSALVLAPRARPVCALALCSHACRSCAIKHTHVCENSPDKQLAVVGQASTSLAELADLLAANMRDMLQPANLAAACLLHPELDARNSNVRTRELVAPAVALPGSLAVGYQVAWKKLKLACWSAGCISCGGRCELPPQGATAADLDSGLALSAPI